jgi:regulator of protease activity HflC (stomatin/prohibitin superfamily)
VIPIDCKNQAESNSFKDVTLKARDQLTSRVDITVNWRVDGDFAAEAYRETGGLEGLRDKYLIPKTRSLIREEGKSVERSEDFFSSDVQIALQDGILTKLKEALSGKGIIIEAVLFRNIELPPSIERGINAKKEMQQEAERAEATLLKFETDQKQKIAQAKAELEAAKTEQERRMVQADAKAYEIEAEAKAKALSIELEGVARAKAIGLEGAALRDNPTLIDLRKAEKWDGKLPTTMFGAGQDVMIDLSKTPKQ